MYETREAVALNPGEIDVKEFENFVGKFFSQFENALSAFNHSVEDGRKFSNILCSESSLSLRFHYGNRGYQLNAERPCMGLSWQTAPDSWEVLHRLQLQVDSGGQVLIGLDGDSPVVMATRKIVQKLFGSVVSAPELEGVPHFDGPVVVDEIYEPPVLSSGVSGGTASNQNLGDGLKGLFGKDFSESPVIDDGTADTGLSRLFNNKSSDSAKTGASNTMLTSQATSLEDAIVSIRDILQSELQNCAHQGSRAFESQDMKAVEQAMVKLNKLKNLEGRVAQDTDEWLEQLA